MMVGGSSIHPGTLSQSLVKKFLPQNTQPTACQLEWYSLPFKVGLYSVVHLFFIYLPYYSGLAY
jgi:hypothetical protein